MTATVFDEITDTLELADAPYAPAVAPESACPVGFEERTGVAPSDYFWPPLGFRGRKSDFARHPLDRKAAMRLLIWVAGCDPPDTPDASSLAQLVRDLRDRIDLPVEDIAAMVGVRRRQFYNLMSGETASSAGEARVRLIHMIVGELEAALDGDRADLRAAILMPVGERYETFHSAAASGDLDLTRAIGRELVDRIEAGQVAGMIERPAPHLQEMVEPGAAERVLDHLRGYAPPPDGTDEESGG